MATSARYCQHRNLDRIYIRPTNRLAMVLRGSPHRSLRRSHSASSLPRLRPIRGIAFSANRRHAARRAGICQPLFAVPAWAVGSLRREDGQQKSTMASLQSTVAADPMPPPPPPPPLPPGLDNFNSGDDAPSAEYAETLPRWVSEEEGYESFQTINGFHTVMCEGFHAGYCSNHRASKGKASQCVDFHFTSQRRRAPIDAATGQVLYWEVPCPTGNEGVDCPQGDACIFAHGRDEISYHPAKYKTRLCNTKGCRGESICCFAHGDAEIRSHAAGKYSYWLLIGQGQRGPPGPRSPPGAVIAGGRASNEWPLVGMVAGGACSAAYHCTTKQRFCASYPTISQCRRGASCAFAHSREECKTKLLSVDEENKKPEALTNDFFMYKFKTHWCPIGVQHDWQTCVYAHNYQDARRDVTIGYGPRPCPYYSKTNTGTDYTQRCPLGLRCPYSHGAKEQLYHPQYFRSVICRDLRTAKCPRLELCAFFHRRNERRNTQTDNIDYNRPLPKENLPESWVMDFLNPPFFPEKGDPADEEAIQMAAAAKQATVAPPFWYGGSGFMGAYPGAKHGEDDSPRTQSTFDGDNGEDSKSTHSSNEDAARHPDGAYRPFWNTGLSPFAEEFKPFGAPFQGFQPSGFLLHPAMAAHYAHRGGW